MSESTEAKTSTTAKSPTKKPVAKPRRRRKTKGEVRLRGVETIFDDEPTDWLPLLELVGVALTQRFMGGTRVRLEDGTELRVYKHKDTRASIHITADGRAFYYDWDGKTVGEGPYDYVEHTRYRAVYGAFHDYPLLNGYDQDQDPHLIERALRYAADGERVPIDPRYPEVYARATEAWKAVDRLAEELTARELQDAARQAPADYLDDDERF